MSADSITGTTGNDTLYGGTGNDTIHGGNGNDYLYGDDDNDLIYGDDGHDVLYGGNGNDTLIGGVGGDTLTGGAGADTFYFEYAFHTLGGIWGDTITDFTHGVDKIDLNNIAETFTWVTGNFDANEEGTAQGHYLISGGNGIFELDYNGDGFRDLQITLVGAPTLTYSDFA